MSTVGHDDSLIDALVAMRPEQTDPVAHLLRAKVRRDLVDATDDPFRLGRFTVLGRLGGGGMGVVYVAYDPDLDRKIALKILHSRGEQGHREMLREGRALARLRHPNVVGVYEVGALEERVFVAMEYVEGPNLRAWLREPRTPAEILARLIEAGRGLAAAHAVDLVHRDFKPENLVIADDGHARVIDFGLARPAEETELVTIEDFASPITSSIRAGTPAYMAPERLAGEPGDARADQYAYCVTLWEALFGARPHDETASRRAPIWIRRVLERGLEEDPARRWPTMERLLAALQRGRTRVRRRALAATAIGLAVAAGLASGAYQWDVARRTAACQRAGEAIDAVWNDDARARVHDALVATGVSYAAETAARVLPTLDEKIDSWRRARAEACMNEGVRATWSRDTVDRVAWCLEDQEMAISSLVALLTRVERPFVQKAALAAAALRASDECLDVEQLARQPSPPVEGRASLRGRREELSRAQALAHAGKYNESLEIASRVRAAAETEAWPPLWAATRQLEADLFERTGKYERAETAGLEAYFAAVRGDAWGRAATAATGLVSVLGSRVERPDEARVWARHAEVALARAGDPSGTKEASRLGALAMVDYHAGDYREAQELLSSAIARYERALGPDHPIVARQLGNLAMVRNTMGSYAEAMALHERVVAIHERSLGPDHPMCAMALSNLANVRLSMGAYAEARALHERALSILERAHGPVHPNIAASLNNLANVHRATGSHEEALALYQRALAIDEQVFGVEHSNVAISLTNLAVIQGELGDHEEARRTNERALTIFEKTLGPEHSNVALVLHNIAEQDALLGDNAAALENLRRALSIAEGALGREHPMVATHLGALAAVELTLRRPARALPLLERALAIFDAHEGVQRGEALACFAMAEALEGVGGDPARALAYAERARAGFLEAGDGMTDHLADVDRWIAKHASKRDARRGH